MCSWNFSWEFNFADQAIHICENSVIQPFRPFFFQISKFSFQLKFYDFVLGYTVFIYSNDF